MQGELSLSPDENEDKMVNWDMQNVSLEAHEQKRDEMGGVVVLEALEAR